MTSLISYLYLIAYLGGAVNAASGATTAPAGVPDQVSPRRTVYEATAVFPTAFPCGGKKLVQKSAVTAANVTSTETIIRSNAVPPSPTSTYYLTTLTSTSTTLCGGYEITSIRPEKYFPVLNDTRVLQYYTTTVTASKTTDIAFVCSPSTRATSVNKATFSGACASATPPTYPDDWKKACPSNIKALTGCPYQCVLPEGYDLQYHCFAQDLTHFSYNYNNDIHPAIECQRCLPPC